MNTEFLTQQVVNLFNSWPPSARTIAAGQIFLMKLVVIATEDDGVSWGMFEGDVSSSYPNHPVTNELLFVWIGDPGVDITATSSDFALLTTTTLASSGGVPVHELGSPDGWEMQQIDSVYSSLEGMSAYSSDVISIARGPRYDDNEEDTMWITVPHSGDSTSRPPIFKIRPTYQMREREFTFVLDGSTSTGEERYGEFDTMLRIMLDGETEWAIRTNDNVATPADSPIGYFGLTFSPDYGMAGSFTLYVNTSNPSDCYANVSQINSGEERAQAGTFYFTPSGQIPTGMYAEITLTMLYKEQFIGSDWIVPPVAF